MTALVTMDATSLIKGLTNLADNLSKELGVVAWKTGQKVKSTVAKEITKELNVKQSVVKAQVTIDRKQPSAVVVKVKKTKRIPLKEFKAKQTKKGVTYKISKTKGRKLLPGGFQGPRPGVQNVKWKGRVFKRVVKARLPIRQVYGVSPYGVFVKNDLMLIVLMVARIELEKQLAERIRYLHLKKSGAI